MSAPEIKKQGLMGRLFGRPANPEPEPRLAAEAEEFAAAAPAESVSPEPAPEPAAAAPPARTSWFKRLSDGLAKTSSRLSSGITGLFTKRKLDRLCSMNWRIS